MSEVLTAFGEVSISCGGWLVGVASVALGQAVAVQGTARAAGEGLVTGTELLWPLTEAQNGTNLTKVRGAGRGDELLCYSWATNCRSVET